MTAKLFKGLFVIVVIAQGVLAAGTWIRYETVAPNNNNFDALRDCEVDSKGTLWYVIGQTGLYSQTPDNQPYKSYTLPAEMLGERMGLYMNTANDSLWIGGRNGMIYAGKNGVFSAKPSIPLIYSQRYFAVAMEYSDMTNVTDFIVDSNGKFIAATDSLAWWLNGNTWEPIGVYTDYPQYQRIESANPGGGGGGLGLGRAALDTNGTIWFHSEISGSGTRIAKNYTLLPLADPFLRTDGIYAAPDGNLYMTPGNNTFVRYKLPDYTPDTVSLKVGSEYNSTLWTHAIWQDENGWIWAGQTHGAIKLVKNDKVMYSWDLSPEPQAFVDFKRAPTGDFWACTHKYLFRYSESYSIPAEATGATIPRHSATQLLSIHTTPGELQLYSAKPVQVRIVSLQGKVVWKGNVDGSTIIPLGKGAWILESRAKGAKALVKTILIP